MHVVDNTDVHANDIHNGLNINATAPVPQNPSSHSGYDAMTSVANPSSAANASATEETEEEKAISTVLMDI